ncbi:hypothetical protein ACS0TY_011592 [Phlomoides rotata]
MKDDDELEMLLGEIPHATSSSDTHHHQQNNLTDHGYGYGHASCVFQKPNGHSHAHGYGENDTHGGMYNDELLKYACAPSPVSGFSPKCDGSSSSLFSGGGARPRYEFGSPPPPPQFQEVKTHLISGNGFCSDFENDNSSNSLDDFSLLRNFSRMYISEEPECAREFPNGVESCNRSPNGAIRMNFDTNGLSDNFRKGFSRYVGFNPSVPRGPMKIEGESVPPLVEMQHDQRIPNLSRSLYPPSRLDEMYARSDFSNCLLHPQVYGANFPMGIVVPDVPSAINRPYVGDSYLYPSRSGMNLIEARDAIYSPNVVQLKRMVPHCGEENVPNGRNKVPLHVRVPQGKSDPFIREDSLIIQGEGVNYGTNRGNAHGLVYHKNGAGRPQEKRSHLEDHLKVASPFSMSKCSSLGEAQGYIYQMAKDQHGCRFLQKMFDEGTSQDVQTIFNEIIDHVVELMMNPFGNYLMQKLLEVCDEQQRMHILLKVTQEHGELVRISLNTHGTRVVQKLIETVKTRQQISIVISALEPGFLALIKDLNGNHVVQRCLQCFTAEDSKFIFVSATKYCVDIAIHQHGCCVLQRCISHSTGELREKLIAEISANGLLLAQDAYGNYVVQFILELRIPSALSKLTYQFEGNYVNLSRQKFSSHVVEKCLAVCNNEVKSKIIHELLSTPYFDQLLQDPHANYVVQTALKVSEGQPLHDSLVDAIESYKVISRNSPYSKRIFSHKVLKR